MAGLRVELLFPLNDPLTLTRGENPVTPTVRVGRSNLPSISRFTDDSALLAYRLRFN